MKEKHLIFNISKEDHIKAFLLLFNGNLKLTDTELKVLEGFIEIYMELLTKKLDVFHINELLFSSKYRKEIRNKVGINSEHSFNNYVSSLKKKGVILEEKNTLSLNETLIPSEKITFEFKLI